jgi:demethylmenaquinone methyltransferase/2-methoxy-6-polyprenyl-1,4-benzoquinol methylase
MTTFTQQDPDSIRLLFDTIAKRYDRGNAVLSFQLHRWWNRILIRSVLEKSPPNTLLDLCSGTGDVALSYLRRTNAPTRAILLDFSKEMLQVAQHKASKMALSHHGLQFLQADAQKIPLPDNSVDAVTIAYGIRNVKDPRRCAEEVFRVLKPGGQFAILELTRPKNRFLRWGHRLYLKLALPRIAGWITSNPNAYHYLTRSIDAFMDPQQMELLLDDVGFRQTYLRRLSGGIASIVYGKKVCR